MAVDFRFGPKLMIGTDKITESRQIVEKREENNEPDGSTSYESDILSDITCYNNKLANRVDTSETGQSVTTVTGSSLYTYSANSLGSHWRKVAGGKELSSDSESDSNSSSDQEIFSAKEITSMIASESSKSSGVKISSMRAIQEENLDDIWQVLKAKRTDYMLMLDECDAQFESMQDQGKKAWEKINEKNGEMEIDHDMYESETVANIEDFMDFARDCVGVIAEKDRVVKFLSRAEIYMRQASNAAITIAVNTKKAENIKKMVDFISIDNEPLTTFEHEDQRYQQVLTTFPDWFKSLPLTPLEKMEIERTFTMAQQDSEFADKDRVGIVMGKFMDILNGWSKNRVARSEASSSWHTVSSKYIGSATPSLSLNGGSTNSIWGSYHVPEIYSKAKKYALNYDSSFSFTSDSNLTDLDGQLQDGKTRIAVEGPNNCIEPSSWSSASKFSAWSEASDGLSDIQSLREPMSLSSYEMKTSTEPSLTDLIHTALSQDNLVRAMPPRTPNSLVADLTTGNSAHGSAYSVSTLSLADMIDDAVHTAVELVEKESHDLMDALRHSATKCGVAINNLLNSSSSSESESATQLSSASEPQL